MSVTGTAVTASSLTLDAVNRMLRTINEYPVAALDTGGTSTAAMAETVLDEVRKEVMEEGWFENTDTKVTLEPDVSDHIVLDSDVLRVDTTSSSAYLNLSVLNGRLYDRDNLTDEFSADVYAEIIRLLSFDNCSSAMREFITCEACRRFQQDIVGNPDKDRQLAERSARARNRLMQSECDTADHYILSTDDARRILGDSSATQYGR